MVKTIKISDENWAWLTRLAGKLQSETGATFSLDKALSHLQKSGQITAFAGAWKVPEKEAQKTAKEVKERWKTWGLRYLTKKEK